MADSSVLPRRAREALEVLAAIERRAESLRTGFQNDLEHTARQIAALQETVRREASERRRVIEAEHARCIEAWRDVEHRRRTLDALIENEARGVGFVAAAWSDFEAAKAEQTAVALLGKSHPAPAAAEAVRAKGRELAQVRARAKTLELQLELLRWHFPWIDDVLSGELVDPPELESFEQAAVEGEDTDGDPVRQWLSDSEYRALSSDERSQRALDRYMRSRKSPWQLGRDYERYIGYLREQAGGKVTYQGIVKGYEDLGRDLLVEKDGRIEVIQCKRWAQAKTVHEKHVFQLFGTVVAARIENPDQEVSGTFVTTTRLSDRAHEFARVLSTRVEEQVPLSDYPVIKCNIQRTSGERIYHLPFDQRYDATVVEIDRGELWVSTAREAERLGFRRAHRWAGERT